MKAFWHIVHMLAAADSQFYVFKFEFSCAPLDKKMSDISPNGLCLL